MKKDKLKRPIYTSCSAWREVSFDKVLECFAIGKYINERVSMSTFGSGLEEIWFVALIMLPEDRIHLNEIHLLRKTKTLEVCWRMDYDRAQATTMSEFREYIFDFFLETMKHAFEVKKVKDFDSQGFLAALEKEGKAWLRSAAEAVSVHAAP
jgi:hypothetical protein